MSDWKSKLYEGYVTTGQSAASKDIDRLHLRDFPYYQNIINKHLSADKTLRIIDLGCGHGSLVFCLKSMGYDNVEGVDVSSEQVQMAHFLGLGNISQGDLSNFLKMSNHRYDVIFLMDVLEHLDKQEVIDLLQLVSLALVDGGKLIVHVPNAEGIFGMRIRYGDFTHQVCFTPRSVQQILLATGFSNISVFEDKPLRHGFKSVVRRLIWDLFTLRERLLFLAETGSAKCILSQNMLVIAEKV